MNVRFEFGEFVVPVSDQQIGWVGPLSTIGDADLSVFGDMLSVTDFKPGEGGANGVVGSLRFQSCTAGPGRTLVLSISSDVNASGSVIPTAF